MGDLIDGNPCTDTRFTGEPKEKKDDEPLKGQMIIECINRGEAE